MRALWLVKYGDEATQKTERTICFVYRVLTHTRKTADEVRGSVAIVGCLSIAATTLAAPAAGTFPGVNGRIVFASNRRADLQLQVFAVPVAGGPARNISRRPANANGGPDAAARLLVYTSSPVAGDAEPAVWLVRRTGERRRLATGIAPAISPDVTRVAYTDPQGSGLFVATVRDGTTLRIADVSATPAWSPDGRWIAYGFANGIEVVSSDGRLRRTLPGASVQLGHHAWSSDGTRLVAEGNEQILTVVDVSTGRAIPLATGSHPAWSPDGLRIAFESGGAIATARPDGSGFERLTSPEDGDGDFSPTWSPDSRSIAFVRLQPALDASAAAVGVVTLPDHALRFVTPPTGHLVDAFGGLAWSSDGETIYYASRSLRDVFHLFTTGANLRGIEQLTRGGGDDRQPAWAPDGRRVAFVRNGNALLVTDGRRERVVVRQSALSSPTWSPDGHRLAYAAGAAVWVSDLARPGRRGLVGGASPAWSPRGGWIVYVRNGLRLVRPDGTGDHWLKADDDFVYRDPFWSPGGDVVYYLVRDRCTGAYAWCGSGGTLAALRPFATVPSDVRLPSFSGDKPALSPDGRFLVFGGEGLLRFPVSGSGTSFGESSSATETEPDWARLQRRQR